MNRNLSTHQIAIYDADGRIRTVRADEIRVCVPTSKCVKFWVQTISCLLAVGLGVFFMIYQGTSSVYFNIGEALLALGIGVLVPSPKYEDVIPTRVSPSSTESPSLQESEPSPTPPDEYSGSTDVTVDVRD